MRFLDGDLRGIDTRRELPALLDAVRHANGFPLDPLFRALAEQDPIALAEVVCGSRAPGGAQVARAALPYAPVLETALSPRGLYPRLIDLSADAAIEVLQVACRRHPAASWLLPLSRKVEAFAPGVTHLLAAAGHPSFAAVCRDHASAGNLEALVIVAGETGRAEPSAALVSVDPNTALRAAAAAMDQNPLANVVPHLASVWGPEPDELLAQLIPHLRSREAAEELLHCTRHSPRTQRLLAAILPGLVRGLAGR